MNLEDLKTEWVQYSKKLAVSHRLNEELIKSMLTERSRSRVSKIRQNNTVYMILMIVNLLLIIAILWGNPFDFLYSWQYIPYGLLAVGILMAIATLIKSFQRFSVNINEMSLDHFLNKVLAEYEKNKRIETWFGRFIFLSGLLTAFSFLPKKLQHKDLWPALGETAISLVITLAVYFIAFKLGAFKNKHREGFESDLKEWNELKGIAADLRIR